MTLAATLWEEHLRPRWRLLSRPRRRGGGRLDCNLCGWKGGFLVRGRSWERQCPRCKGANRHRLIAWYLRARGLPRPGAAVLHVAPEPGLRRFLAAAARSGYATCDLARADVDHRLDLQSETLGAARFDLILINHVLEHVPDDRAVLDNLRVMLKPGGLCLITVPMRADDGPTDEDASVTDPADRARRFGQHDHLRLYGPDLVERLADAGFAAEAFTSADADPAAVARHAMQNETIFLARRRA